MTDSIRFIMLTESQEKEIESYDMYHVTGVALNSNNECVSLCTQSWPMRYQLCDSCTGKCAWGGIQWTREDYRGQGIFTNLFFWLKEEAGLDKTYISKNYPFHFLLADKYNFSIPKNIDDLPSIDDSPYNLLPNVLNLVDKITQLFNGGS